MAYCTQSKLLVITTTFSLPRTMYIRTPGLFYRFLAQRLIYRAGHARDCLWPMTNRNHSGRQHEPTLRSLRSILNMMHCNCRCPHPQLFSQSHKWYHQPIWSHVVNVICCCMPIWSNYLYLYLYTASPKAIGLRLYNFNDNLWNLNALISFLIYSNIGYTNTNFV